ncbi:hypothetical protein AB0I27_22425 [Streptomyces sp. NPDC050597]|uniref:hypothetical protein n=1 Tax=Streptomyces sp. NPDC050597 TaxID=3157212 RepID=UPI00341FB5FA
MVEAQTIRTRITQDGKPFAEVDVQVYPWHIANYGGDWEMWLRNVAPEWVDRMASGIREETFHATATEVDTSRRLADVEFVHSTPKTVTVTVENKAATQLREGLDKLFERLGPPAAEKEV